LRKKQGAEGERCFGGINDVGVSLKSEYQAGFRLGMPGSNQCHLSAFPRQKEQNLSY
jgi:hypothetical protein